MAIIIDENFFNEPLLSTPLVPKNFRETFWRDLNTPSALIFVGDKRSGKDNAMDTELEIGLDTGFTCLSIFDGGGHEKLYTAISKNCRGKWKIVDKILQVFEKMDTNVLYKDEVKKQLPFLSQRHFDKFLGLMANEQLIKMGEKQMAIIEKGMDELNGKLLHCNCHKPRPVTVIKPPYVKYDKHAVDRFNGYYFRDYFEYQDALLSGKINELIPPDSDFTKIRKPRSITDDIKPMLKIVESPVPRGSKENIKQFLEVFKKALLDCREERRFLVAVNTEFYPPNHEGKLDLYHTFAVIMNYLRPIANEEFRQLKLDKPRDQWSDEEKSWHKIMLFVGEVRKPVPAQNMSPDPEAQISKRAFFAFMPQSRHAKTWVRVNAQSIGDVLKGVNKQQDLIIVKRSSDRNLGDELSWLKKAVENDIEEQLIRWKVWKIQDGKVIYTPIPPIVKGKLLAEKNLVRIAEMPDNKAYVVNGNGDWRMTTYGTPSWHHKSDRDEFYNDTGILFKIDENYNYADKMIEDEDGLKSSGISKKEHKNQIYQKVYELDQTTDKSQEEIFEELKNVFAGDDQKMAILDSWKLKSFKEGYRLWRIANKKS